MGCCGDREKGDEYVKTEQRWDYINLDEFKTKSCWTALAYGWLWLMLIVSVSVYCVDTFTAVNLIVFDKWSGQIKPVIPFTIARWIFAGCIIASFVLLLYRWWRAIRVMKQGGVAKSYLDPLAVRIQSIRMGKEGRGYKRFLVFAELTKSRKGADYVALFSYYSFEAWLRIVFAEGPRQVVNALTLYSVMQTSLLPVGNHAATKGNSPFVQFWLNVGALAESDKLQAAILLGMLWTLLIWVLAAISLAVSVVLYLIFLWHHIPSRDGTLSKYCRNKINRRMQRIVKVKVDKALKKENEIRTREEAKAERDGLKLKTQPTLPDISADPMAHPFPPLSRQDTMTTLPEYDSRPGSAYTGDDVPPMPGHFNDPYRPGSTRHATQRSDVSWSSYNSNAPLMSSAADMGMHTPSSARPMPLRSGTGFSERSHTPGFRPPPTQAGNSYQMNPLPRSTTSASNRSNGSDFSLPRSQTPASGHPPPAGTNGSYFPTVSANEAADRQPPGSNAQGRSFTYPNQPTRSFTPVSQPQRSFTPGGYHPARQPSGPDGAPPRSFTPGAAPPRAFTPQGMPPPQRTVTPFDQPTLPQIDTAMPTQPGYMAVDQRSATPVSANVMNRSQPPYPIGPSSNPYQQRHQQQHQPPIQNNNSNSNHSFGRPMGLGLQNTDVARNSGVDDILNHY